MPPEDLEGYLRATPFAPFRLLLSTGRTCTDIHHPELVMVGKRSVIVGITQDPTPRYDRSVTVAHLHIVRLEPIDAATAQGNGQ